MKSHVSLYEAITNDIIAQLEKGVAPWVKPWTTEAGEVSLLPHNAATGHRYKGVNVLILWTASMLRGYRNPAWIGFHQAQGLGGHVRRGEKSTTIVYGATFVPKEDREKPEEERQHIPFLKRRLVFNIDQIVDLPSRFYEVPEPVPLQEAIEHVETFLRTIGAQVRHGGDRACYIPALDCIALPSPDAFQSASHYYATNLHEHTHWSGHASRLDRDLSGRFGDEAYAAEELIAELASAYLCAFLSIPGQLRHAEYIAQWLKILKNDRQAIFTASARAMDAALYLSVMGGQSIPLEEGVEEEDAREAA